VLARADATTVGVIGAGTQAWTQLWALTAVREIDRVRVYSPTLEPRKTSRVVRPASSVSRPQRSPARPRRSPTVT
jgi:ornithine cyclodeaminase/alanine dehydrogenase-like protein (mu-crystallin family)